MDVEYSLQHCQATCIRVSIATVQGQCSLSAHLDAPPQYDLLAAAGHQMLMMMKLEVMLMLMVCVPAADADDMMISLKWEC